MVEWYQEDERSKSLCMLTSSESEGSGVSGDGERDAVAVVGADMAEGAGAMDRSELEVILLDSDSLRLHTSGHVHCASGLQKM